MTFGQALAAEVQSINQETGPAVVPGEILRTAAVESTSDKTVVSGVIAALKNAKRNGTLKGFGVDVQSHNGVLQLTGRAGPRNNETKSFELLKVFLVFPAFARRLAFQRVLKKCHDCPHRRRCNRLASRI